MKLRTILVSAAIALAACVRADLAQHVPNVVLVRFKANASPWAIRAAHARIGGRVRRIIPRVRVHVVQVPSSRRIEEAMAYYQSTRLVQYAEPDYIKKPRDYVPNDPSLNRQYSMLRMNLFKAWDLEKGDPAVKIAIIDTGIDMDHPDLQSKISDPWDQADGDNNPQDDDVNFSHGTHCAGIAAAATDNGVGIAGAGFNCSIMPIRFNFTSSGSAESMIRAADHGAQVISMSYGGPTPTGVEDDAVQYAWNQGVVLLAAAGNDNSDSETSIGYPSLYENVINVGATNSADQKAGFSNFGPTVDIAAPGEGIYSTIAGDTYANADGTSMACPNAAGVVGLMWSRASSSVTNDMIRAILYANCDPVGTWVVKGRVNALGAVEDTPKSIIVTTTAPPVFLGVWEGTATTSSSRVLVEDGQYFSINSRTMSGLGQVASAYFRFGMPVDRDSVMNVRIVTTAKFAAGATGQVFLWNWVTNRWDNLKSFQLAEADMTLNATLRTQMRTYASASGEVRALIRGIVPNALNRPTVASFDIDFLQLEATYELIE